MNQLFGFGSKSEEEMHAEIEENVPNNTNNTRESGWKQFHKFIQGCIHLLKIIAGITILHLFSRKKPGLHSKNYKSGSRIAGEKWREYLKMPNINLN
jgi:hypothetical protein